MLTLDLVAEEDGAAQDDERGCDGCWETEVLRSRQRADTDVSKLRVASEEVKTGSLPRGSERSWGRSSHLEAAQVHKKHQAQVDKHPLGSGRGLTRFPPWLQVLQAQSRTPQPGKRLSAPARGRCASMDEVLSSRYVSGRSRLLRTSQEPPRNLLPLALSDPP